MKPENIVREWDGARLVVVDGRPTLQLIIVDRKNREHGIAVTASLSQSKAKDGKPSLPYANLVIGGEQVRFMPEVVGAIESAASRVDSEEEVSAA
jgi:hypothetical protein